MNRKIDEILDLAIERGASDIHLTNKRRPSFRIDGLLIEIEEFDVNDNEFLHDIVDEILDEISIDKYNINKSIDASMSYGDTRFRVHTYKQKESDCIVLRLIPTVIPTLEELSLPSILKKFSTLRNGLVIVTGVTGSGKSTTLASIIKEINTNYAKNIITVENPVEFIHEHGKSIINQREIGVDVLSFSDAVTDAMRADPDILLIGEMRDLDTITNAITMAETGHLVFGTLHTKSAPETIDRIIDVFPPGQQEQIRIQLANSIEGIISQELLPRVGGGRVPSCEVMIANDAIRSLIRESGNPNSILDAMQANSRTLGSQTRTQSLAQLLIDGYVDKNTIRNCIDKSELETFNKLLVNMR